MNSNSLFRPSLSSLQFNFSTSCSLFILKHNVILELTNFSVNTYIVLKIPSSRVLHKLVELCRLFVKLELLPHKLHTHPKTLHVKNISLQFKPSVSSGMSNYCCQQNWMDRNRLRTTAGLQFLTLSAQLLKKNPLWRKMYFFLHFLKLLICDKWAKIQYLKPVISFILIPSKRLHYMKQISPSKFSET